MSIAVPAVLAVIVLALSAGDGRADDWGDCANVAAEDRAITACTRLIARGRLSRTNAGTVFSNRGAAHLNLGDYDLALRDLNEALHFDPSSPHAHYNRGVTNFFMKDYEQAIIDLTASLGLRPSDAKCHYYRGRAQSSLGRHSLAIADFTAVVRLEPEHRQALLRRGRAFQLEGDLNSALADYDRVLALDPADADALGYRANVLLKLGRLDNGLVDADRSLGLAPNDVYAIATRGAILEAMGRYDEALSEFNKALGLEPTYRDAAEGRERLLNRSGANRQSDRREPIGQSPLACDSIDTCSERLRGNPLDVSALIDRGFAYMERNEDDKAINDFTRAVEIDPARAEAFYGRGFIHLGRNEARIALADLSDAIRLRPNASRAYVMRADAHLKLGLFGEALVDAERAIELDPRSGIAHLLKAEALGGLGRRGEAIASARRAAELEPNRPAARELLARIERDAAVSASNAGASQAADEGDASRRIATDGLLRLLGRYSRTGSALLLGLAGRHPTQNIVLSPFSIGSAMALALHGASGETEREMRRVLAHDQSREEIARSNAMALRLLAVERPRAGPLPPWAQALVSPLARGPGFEVKIANALAVREGAPLAPAFMSDLQTSFGAQALEGATLQSINEWIRAETGGRLQRILDRLDPAYVAVLLNAVTMSARWETPFDPRDTADREFTLKGGSVKQVPTMRLVGTFVSAAAQGMSVIRIPFADPKADMIVVMPDNPAMLDRDNLVATFSTRIDAALEQLSKASPQRMELTLPRFNIAIRNDLVELFKVMGIRKAFDPANGEFDHLTGTPGARLVIDQIQHGATFEVGELGTEAAAATAVSLAPGAGRRTDGAGLPAFHVDRPFYFSVGDGRSAVKLFAGVVVDPSP